jgi:threonine dehydrogenase-like Zn-dependent dehydrogenase
MKAIQIKAPRNAVIVDIPVPAVAENEVLVKVDGCVTCPQWDITLFKGVDILERPGYPKYPVPWGYPGHEMVGRVTAKGSKVTTLQVGDRIASLRNAGAHLPGYYADYINLPENYLTRIPDCVSDEAAASMEMSRFVNSYVRLLGNLNGKRTGVTGCGPAGLIALQLLKAAGAAEVVAVDVLPERLALARKLGATDTVNSSTSEIEKITKNRFFASVDCSGVAAALQIAVDCTQGPVAVFGLPHGSISYGIKNVGTSLLVPYVDPDAEDTGRIIELWKNGKLNTKDLVSARLPFSQYAKAVEMLMNRQAVKVFLYPD